MRSSEAGGYGAATDSSRSPFDSLLAGHTPASSLRERVPHAPRDTLPAGEGGRGQALPPHARAAGGGEEESDPRRILFPADVSLLFEKGQRVAPPPPLRRRRWIRRSTPIL